MIIIFTVLLALALPTHEQSTPISPCPNVFSYEPPGSEPGRWYGVVNLSTDSTLHSLWLNIVLDSKADILGNWIGDVSTTDNIDFKIENTEMKINPGPAVAVRFFVQYNPLNKTPRLKAIRLNGRQICNANTPQTSNNIPENTNVNQRPARPTTSRPLSTLPSVRPEDRPETRPVQSRPQKRPSEGPVYVRPINEPSPSSIDGGETVNKGTQTQQRPTYNNNNNNNNNNNGYDFTTSPTRRTTTRRPIDIPDFDNDNVSNGNDDRETPQSSDYFSGGQITFTLPSSSSTNSNKKPDEPQCGKVTLNNPIPLVVNGTPTLEGQWPWQIALYQTQTVDNKYICGGTLVTHKHIITAAHCVTLKGSRRVVNKNTLTVYLGKHNLRTSVDGVQIRFVEKITVHPDYNATIFSRDLAILSLREPVSYTDWVRSACIWPDNQQDLSYVVGKKGSVVGWGYDDTGVATEELTLVEMPVVSQETCIRSYSEFFVRFTSDYTYCAGFRDGTSVCNGDSGGGMVFKLGNTWYVRGLVSVSVARENEYRCDPSHYVIFTDLAKFLPWIRRQISDY